MAPLTLCCLQYIATVGAPLDQWGGVATRTLDVLGTPVVSPCWWGAIAVVVSLRLCVVSVSAMRTVALVVAWTRARVRHYFGRGGAWPQECNDMCVRV